MDCLNCGKNVPQTEGKRAKLYCDEACKKAFQRKAKLVDNGTEDKGTNISGQPGRCYKCGAELAYAKQTCCGPCAWVRQGYAHEGRRPDFQSQGAVLTGGYRMTNYEIEHYRPEDQLKKGEYNPVSKPGYPGGCSCCTRGKAEAEVSPQARGVGGGSVSEE